MKPHELGLTSGHNSLWCAEDADTSAGTKRRMVDLFWINQITDGDRDLVCMHTLTEIGLLFHPGPRPAAVVRLALQWTTRHPRSVRWSSPRTDLPLRPRGARALIAAGRGLGFAATARWWRNGSRRSR